MSRALRILVAAAVFFGGIVSLFAAENGQLARGTAITDPDLLRELDQHDALTISRLLWPRSRSLSGLPPSCGKTAAHPAGNPR